MNIKKLLITFVLPFSLLTGCLQEESVLLRKDNTSKALLNNKITTIPYRNENILAKALLFSEWLDVPEIMSNPYNNLRNTIIAKLDEKCNNQLSHLQSMSDNELAWAVLMHKFIFDGEYRTYNELKNMSLDDYRNTIIVLNAANTLYSISQLQSFDNAKNLNIAYHWWLTRLGSSTRSKIDVLRNIRDNSFHKFDAKDNQNVSLECLSIVKADEAYTYLGVYHTLAYGNCYKLRLIGSNDLINWIFLSDLGDRSHQGCIKKWGDGYVIANEQDPTFGSNNLRVRYFASYTNLIANNPSNDIVLPRNFSTTAEGTPDIRSIIGQTPQSSHIVIGFHYFDNNRQDQIAIGILHNFTNWRAWKDDISNYNIKEMGFQGNFGDRSGFTHHGDWVLQEAQITPNDWSSWRMLFGNGAFYANVNPTTPLGSYSFANPSITSVNQNQFIVSSFMPTEGNINGERGELIYTVAF